MFYLISGMLITNGSRQCVLSLKKYSDKRTNSSHRNSSKRSKESNNDSPNKNGHRNASNININASTTQLTEITEDRSWLGRLLNCKPCLQVTDTNKRKIVCPSFYVSQENQKFIFLGRCKTYLGR
jgi:hypothetical protein